MTNILYPRVNKLIRVALVQITAIACVPKIRAVSFVQTDGKALQYIRFLSIIFHHTCVFFPPHLSSVLHCLLCHNPQAENIDWKILAVCRRSYCCFSHPQGAVCDVADFRVIQCNWSTAVRVQYHTTTADAGDSLQVSCVSWRREWRHSRQAESISMLAIPHASLLSVHDEQTKASIPSCVSEAKHNGQNLVNLKSKVVAFHILCL